jgi:hypothetical protein
MRQYKDSCGDVLNGRPSEYHGLNEIRGMQAAVPATIFQLRMYPFEGTIAILASCDLAKAARSRA